MVIGARMDEQVMGALKLRTAVEHWPLATPLRIAGHTFDVIAALVIRLEKAGKEGWAEAAGVYYHDENGSSMQRQVEAQRPALERGISRRSLQELLAPGGARNALDCALWDLEAKLAGLPCWKLAGLPEPRPLLTTFTCGADRPEAMAAVACGYTQARAIKLKLTGEGLDAERIRAVREARPDVWLGVDANQSFTRSFLEQLTPVLLEARVALIEQPFRVGQEHLLEGLHSPIPVAADESAQTLADLPALVGRFNVVNIKLDKCGGLTEGLAMARAARSLGLDTMVGNMPGTSLAMAPAFLLGQLCDVVDLDGAIFLKRDRDVSVHYADGFFTCPDKLWGSAG